MVFKRVWSKVTPRKVKFRLKLSGVLRIDRKSLRLKEENSHLSRLRDRCHLEDHSISLLRAAWTAVIACSTFGEEAQIMRPSA